jgi:hypothetical protein
MYTTNSTLAGGKRLRGGEAATKLTGKHRAAVPLVVEEAKSRKGMDAEDFPSRGRRMASTRGSLSWSRTSSTSDSRSRKVASIETAGT